MFKPELRSELYYIIPKELQKQMIENDPLNANCFLYALYYVKDLFPFRFKYQKEYIADCLFWEIYNDRRKYYNIINEKIEEINRKNTNELLRRKI